MCQSLPKLSVEVLFVICSGNLFQSLIVLQKNENVYESLLHCICLMVFDWVDLVLDWLGIRMLSYGTAILLLIILQNICNLVFRRLSCSVGQPSECIISVTLLVLWFLWHAFLAARLCTCSILWMCSVVIWVPNRAAVFQFGSYKRLVCSIFYRF